MAKGRRTKDAPARSRRALLLSGAALVLLAAGAAYALWPRGEAPPPTFTPVTDFADVHGLAVSPEDPDVVYVATHRGLVRGEEGAWALVGTAQDDLMGFTMHPTNASTFWVSGHPRGGGNMGVRRSTDGGLTWETLYAEPVDFHAMAVSRTDPDLLWGHYAGAVHASSDGGRTWAVASASPPPIRALAAHATDAGALYAATGTSIAVSRAGATWTTVADLPAWGVAVDPSDPRVLYASGRNVVWRSSDAGASWTPVATPADGTFGYLSVSPTAPRTLYVASYETGVYRSDDAGATWRELKAAH